MTRREKLENIIIGTLLDGNARHDYYKDCRSCISSSMFQDETNRRIFDLIVDMREKGNVETDPCSILSTYGEAVTDLAIPMAERCAKYSFLWLKTDYNEKRYIASLITGEEYEFTDVEFTDYVNQFISLVNNGEKTTDRHHGTEAVAA